VIPIYTINATSGALKPVTGSPFGPGTNPWGVVVHPTGKFAYVAKEGDFTVSGYTINATSGALTPVTGPRLGQAPILLA
jgi:DNA-binding beta-propeller fold protein YncE